MSFYSMRNSCGNICPGRVEGDAMCGMRERVCIEVKKVYDSCMQQDRLEDVEICVKNIHPKCVCPQEPLTFVSCRSKSSKGKLCNLEIERIPSRENFARVKVTVIIPIEVVFTDATGAEFVGCAHVKVHKDVILYVPNESIIPVEIDNLVSAICVTGTWTGGTSFDITVCVTVILKVVADVNLLVPSYGFCPIPPCEEFAENVCDEFFSLPIWPPQLEDEEAGGGRNCPCD